MLKYKLNIKDKKNDTIEVEYDSLFLSEDGSEITGVTEPSYGLNEIDSIVVVSNETKTCRLIAQDVMRCGYVLYNKVYKIQDFGDTYGILFIDGQYYCVDKDYDKFYQNIEGEVLSETASVLVNPFITIDNHQYDIGEWIEDEETEETNLVWKSEITIPTKYWSYNDKIQIDNIIYDVIIDTKTQMVNDDEYYPYIILNDMSLDDSNRILYVIDWEYSKRKKKTLFKISNYNQTNLNVNEVFCVQQFDFFDKIDTNGDAIRVYSHFYEDKMEFFAEMFKEGKEILSEWKKVEKSNTIDLYIKENVNSFPNDAIIYITPIHNHNIVLRGEKNNGSNDIVFKYYSKEFVSDYSKKKNFLKIEGEEYEIYDYFVKEMVGGELVDVNKPYIIFNKIPLSVSYSNSNKTKAKINNRFDVENIEYDVVKYNHLKVGKNIYKVYEKDANNFYCEVYRIEPFKLQIINRFGNNVFRCMPCDNENLSDLFASMYNSQKNFICEIKTPIFDSNLISPLTDYMKNYITSKICLYINHNSFIVPITLKKETALDIHKDYITHNNFFEAKTNELVNRIVDMEKDIYYPAYAEQKGNETIITLCHQIQIDLHFRSRDLSTWVINDENNIKQEITHPTNWNIFDYYRYSNDNTPYKEFYPTLNLQGDNQYFPPSDLLYFLKFTDEDVFYQKQKIGKSFLRLSFYNSKDPKTQSLLYTSTIFMSETTLFQKYINADNTESEYITIKDRGYNKETIDDNGNIETTYSVSEHNIVKHIGVDTEPCESNKMYSLTFNEEKRLSSSFMIKNRQEAVDSCEGFYLYLFKEYSQGLHESTIYMKVQFNHAGLGKTVNFMQMYHQSGTKKSMLNWNSKYNFEKYKDGCPLSELYDHLYIEIKIKYDLKNKRFCYYLPQWMSEKNSDKHTMRLSLFEVKIKDESK